MLATFFFLTTLLVLWLVPSFAAQLAATSGLLLTKNLLKKDTDTEISYTVLHHSSILND